METVMFYATLIAFRAAPAAAVVMLVCALLLFGYVKFGKGRDLEARKTFAAFAFYLGSLVAIQVMTIWFEVQYSGLAGVTEVPLFGLRVAGILLCLFVYAGKMFIDEKEKHDKAMRRTFVS
ncbi:hypothetical protein [Vibrio barjaei]|uniref:hypothetical protein n=1 Tax=Vibrio barjaei TaxID=1676683 RepID=UPI0022835090|nr:hypothetical protein [Vibrio barjaei]MCY9872978.1 hypothetical protein [Vibrio barjaei]